MWIEVMHNWFKKHPDRQPPLRQTIWRNVRNRFMDRRRWLQKTHSLKETAKGQELIDSFVDKDFNVRRDELAEGQVLVAYHTSLYFLRHLTLLEMIVKDFFNKGISKRWWLMKMGELPVYFVRGPKKDRFTKYQSMRKTMLEISPEPLSESEENLVPLQLGR